MTKTQLFTQSSPWFIIVCLLVGGLYAFVLYNKKPIWSKQLNFILAGIRWLIVSFICFLLLSPVIKQIKNYIEKPIVLIAVDNSESIKEVHNHTFLNQLLTNLEQQGNALSEEFQVDYLTFSAEELKRIDSVKFNYPVTNLSSFLSGIQSRYENMNLTSVVLLSDGIVNQGVSPNYLPYNFTIFPVALGDTIPKKDLNLKNLLYNKVAYRGNKFPVVAEFSGEGFDNTLLTLSLKQNDKVIETQQVKLVNGNNNNQVTFYTSADKPGLQHYSVSITPLSGEFTSKNNYANAYIDIIDNKEKILFIAFAPHPDVKAIKSALETKENYDFKIYIPGIDEPPKDSKYDLIIFHEIPDQFNTRLPVFTEYMGKSKNHLFIVGNQSNINQFSALTHSIDIIPRGQKDEVLASFNPQFNRFNFTTEAQDIIAKYPPIIVPFADYQVSADYDVVLYQKVGTVQTNKPIVAVGSSNDTKTGVIIGNGIWAWRLQEYAETEKTQVFDELITKVVQYLSSKEDKRKFRFSPLATEVYENEPIVFETEVYNNIYEKIYGQKVDIILTDEKGHQLKYNYINSQNNSKYEVGGLKSGIYRYKATTQIDGKIEACNGEFIEKELQLEALNTTANHSLLRELARSSGGKMFYPSQINTIKDYLVRNKAQGKIHSSEENLELIHLKWLFFVLIALASAEWLLRKYNGAY